MDANLTTKKVRAGLLAGAGALALAIATSAAHDTCCTILHQVDVLGEKIRPEANFRVVQISDFHALTRTRQINTIVSRTRQINPELVAITGDLVNTHSTDLSGVERLFAGLSVLNRPICFVWGNHDHWNAQLHPSDRLSRLMDSYGLIQLNNMSIPLDGPWGQVDVIGTDDYFTGRGDLAQAMTDTRPDAYHLVLTHAPEIRDDLAVADVDLALCGHTHAGQVRVPGLGALLSPGQPLLPRYDRGIFPVGKALMYVDSGVGTTHLPFRIWNPSRISLLEISAA